MASLIRGDISGTGELNFLHSFRTHLYNLLYADSWCRDITSMISKLFGVSTNIEIFCRVYQWNRTYPAL